MSPHTLFAIDWSQVPAAVVHALQSGAARVMNGVARDTSNFTVLKHMPFRPVSMSGFDELPQRAKSLQDLSTLTQGSAAAIQTALAVSTALTVGSVVISTAYLASKLRDLEAKIERLEGELRGQNLLFYASKASNYFGAVEATRELIAAPELVAENPDLVAHALSRLASQRHETFAFLGNLFRLFEGKIRGSHQALAIDFFHGTLDYAPKAVFVEVQAAYRLERFRLGTHILASAGQSYGRCLIDYKTWANGQLKSLIRGRDGPSERLVAERLQEARRVVGSEENRLLLDCSV